MKAGVIKGLKVGYKRESDAFLNDKIELFIPLFQNEMLFGLINKMY